MNANVKESTLDTLGDKDVNTTMLYANIASDKEGFRKFLELPEIDIKGDNLAGMTEQAKLISVWRSLQTAIEIDDKADAERKQLKLPPTISKKDIEAMRKLFEKTPEGFPVEKMRMPIQTVLPAEDRRDRGGLRSRAPHDGHDGRPGLGRRRT